MQQSTCKKVIINKGLIFIGLALVIYLLMVFADHPNQVEIYYSKGLYPFICRVLHPVFNIFPFSLGDVIYAGVIVYLLYAIVRLVTLCFKKYFMKAGIFAAALIIGVQVGIILFYLGWGMNYFRPSAAERLGLRYSTYTLAELQKVTTILIDSANACRRRITPADMGQSNDVIYDKATHAMLKLSETSAEFRTYSPRIKPSLLTPLLNYIGTSGYYNPFTTEAQINNSMPVFNRPFVACHEMSHQMGYGPEDEANFAGFRAATASGDRLLRYSAYYLAVGEFMQTMRAADSVLSKQLKTRISPLVRADFKQERLFWLSYQNRIDVVTGIFYDNFLKANNQPQGLETYNRMVLLIMAMYKQEFAKGAGISQKRPLALTLKNQSVRINILKTYIC